MFRGASEINLDAKGRLAIPARYREEIDACCGGRLVLTLDATDPCLCLYPLPEWTAIEAQLRELPSMDGAARNLKHLLIGNAEDVQLDGSERILIPKRMRELAQFDRRVVLVGQLNKFQVWSEARWQAVMTAALEAIKQPGGVPEEMRGLIL